MLTDPVDERLPIAFPAVMTQGHWASPMLLPVIGNSEPRRNIVFFHAFDVLGIRLKTDSPKGERYAY